MAKYNKDPSVTKKRIETIVRLHDIEGKSFKDISSSLGISKSYARTLYLRSGNKHRKHSLLQALRSDYQSNKQRGISPANRRKILEWIEDNRHKLVEIGGNYYSSDYEDDISIRDSRFPSTFFDHQLAATVPLEDN